MPDAPDDPVLAALRATPRARFLPRGQRRHADEDRALPLWHGSTASQPSTVAAMLRLLAVPRGAHVLDVGAGSGWTTALLAHLVGPHGEVLGLELDPEVAAWGAANVARHLDRRAPHVRLERAEPGTLGRARPGGWDRILVSAAAAELPGTLVGMLADPGRLVLPVGARMHLVVLVAGRITDSTHGSYAFVPLR